MVSLVSLKKDLGELVEVPAWGHLLFTVFGLTISFRVLGFRGTAVGVGVAAAEAIAAE